jgi:hypothetical protein
MKRARSDESYWNELRALTLDDSRILLKREFLRQKDGTGKWRYIVSRRGMGLVGIRSSAKAALKLTIDAFNLNHVPNPVPPSSRVQIREAIRLYEDFSGHDGETIAKLAKPEYPDVVLAIGELDAVCYTTVRDGKEERYIHDFRKKSRPLLCCSHDGKTLIILGGEFQFTERGIVDK